MKKHERIKRPLCVFAALLCLTGLLAMFIHYQNNALQTSYYTVRGEGELKILQLSDLHSKDFKGKLAEQIRAEEPDVIFLTGDIFNKAGKDDLDGHDAFLAACTDTAPTYFVTGNHELTEKARERNSYTEFTLTDLTYMEQLLSSHGVIWLNNESSIFEKNGTVYNIIGLSDVIEYCPTYKTGTFYSVTSKAIREILPGLIKEDAVNILLSHRPEYFEVYSEFDIDLVFSGHAHGGQFRFFGRGLYAPGQGVLPKLTEGVHENNGTTLVISRGLGPSRFPLRLFNRPEIVSVTVTAK